MEQSSGAIHIRAYRFDPANPDQAGFQSYWVPTVEPLSVMVLMAEIHALDETFSCRTSTCFKGQCGSCLVRVNGRDALGCVTMVQPGETVTLEPHSKYRVLRDLVVDFSQPQEG
jgi:succinate dehydrogenase / fumarate reductase iron-sulfur subunit